MAATKNMAAKGKIKKLPGEKPDPFAKKGKKQNGQMPAPKGTRKPC